MSAEPVCDGAMGARPAGAEAAPRGEARGAAERPYEPRPGAPLVEALDEQRSAIGTWLFIASEAMLFALLFFAYYYLAQGPERRWLVEEPPALKFALPMLAVLLVSSAVLYWGEERVKKRQYLIGRVAAGATLVLGSVFLVLSYFEYRDHLQHLLPTSNAYGSIFYTITSLHLAHLILGMLMLAYVLVLPPLEPTDRPPHRAYHAASLYWHFVDTVWLVVVALLYVTPNLRT